MKKIIALDIDGTLYNDEKKITPVTAKALKTAQENGNTVVLASGRPTPGLYIQSKELELEKYHGLLISYNGGKVTDVTTGEVLYENPVPNKIAKKLLKHLESFNVNPIVDDGKYIYTNNLTAFKNDFESQQNRLELKKVDNIHDSVDFDPVKILIAAPHEILFPVVDDICRPFENELSFVMSAPFYLEATVKGVTKADALKQIGERLGVDRKDIISFGDAENDMSMIQFAGVGVAMGNACDTLKKAADMITLSNNDDGIAYALEKLL